jgi:hypothetical protein
MARCFKLFVSSETMNQEDTTMPFSTFGRTDVYREHRPPHSPLCSLAGLILQQGLVLMSGTILLLLTGVQTPASGQCVEYQDFTHAESVLDTPGYDVEVAGSYAYLVADSLLVLDITNPSAPFVQGGIELPSTGYGIALAESKAYIAEYTAGLQIVSIANPSAPVLVGGVTLPGYSTDVSVSGHYAYVANYRWEPDTGVQVVDISNPASPELLTTLPTPGYAHTVDVDGGYLYVGNTDPGSLSIYSLEDPASPLFVENLTLSTETVEGLNVHDAYAYVGCEDSGLIVVGISDPTSPSIVAILDTPGRSRQSTADGSLVYLADGPGGFQVIDVSSPASPRIIGSVTTNDEPYGVALAGNYAYVSGGAELGIIDVSNPNSPSAIGHSDTPGAVMKMVVVDGFAYITELRFGLRIFDISNPLTPTAVGSLPIAGATYGIAVSGLYACVPYGSSDNWGGIAVINVSNPTAPVLLGSLSLNHPAVSIAISGAYAYVFGMTANFTRGRLDVVSILNPTHPVLRGSVDLPEACEGCDLAVAGSYAYVADWAGLVIIDISIPTAPTIVTTVSSTTPADVALQGSYAYVTDEYQGMNVIDISNPAAPLLLGGLTMPLRQVRGISVDGRYVYLASRFSMVAVDALNLAAPTILGSIGMPDLAIDVAQDGSYAYVTARLAGFYVVPLECPDVQGTDEPEPVAYPAKLLPPSPNPMTDIAMIRFSLPRGGEAELTVCDAAGRRVRRLCSGILDAGSYERVWDGRDESSHQLPAGVYFVRLAVSGETKTTAVIRLR